MAESVAVDSAAIDLDSAPLPECEETPPLAPSAAAFDVTSEPAPDAAPPDLQSQIESAQQREQEARRALNLLISIMDELPVGLTVQSDDGKTLFTNGTAGAYFGTVPTS